MNRTATIIAGTVVVIARRLTNLITTAITKSTLTEVLAMCLNSNLASYIFYKIKTLKAF